MPKGLNQGEVLRGILCSALHLAGPRTNQAVWASAPWRWSYPAIR